MTARSICDQLRALSTPESAQSALRFFKPLPGQSKINDVFLGIRAADMHNAARQHRALPEREVIRLLHSKYHECRMVALLIWVEQARIGDLDAHTRIAAKYLANTQWVDNWDLVDATARPIIGEFVAIGGAAPDLFDFLARSRLIWERRIAIVATLAFIRRDLHDHTLRIAEKLLGDKYDLIHKATGWMLREVGKRDQPTLERFLKTHYAHMPRTALRYAIERFPAARRQAYLKGTP